MWRLCRHDLKEEKVVEAIQFQRIPLCPGEPNYQVRVKPDEKASMEAKVPTIELPSVSFSSGVRVGDDVLLNPPKRQWSREKGATAAAFSTIACGIIVATAHLLCANPLVFAIGIPASLITTGIVAYKSGHEKDLPPAPKKEPIYEGW